MDSISRPAVSPEVRHVVLALYFAVFFPLARYLLDNFVYRRMATKMLSKGLFISKLDDVKHVKIIKCSESMWKFTYYAVVQVCIILITYKEPWFRDTKEFFIGWPDQDLKFSLQLYYMCQCGFYIYSIVALLNWETRRKDFSVMMSHHIITVMLIGYSYITRFFRIGSIVLALHDASDVFMEAAKIFKYSEHELAASIFFACFALSWLLLRLMYFPWWVIGSLSTEALAILDMSSSHITALYYAFSTMLLMLLIFHLYWWILICSMISRQLKNRGKVGDDIRSDSEDED